MKYKCEGCKLELLNAYDWDIVDGLCAGIETIDGHLFFFVVDEKTGNFVVPFPNDFFNS